MPSSPRPDSAVATIVADAAGLVTAWNRGAVDLVGYQPDEILGRDVAMLVPEDYRERHHAGFRRAMARTAGEHDDDAPAFHLPVVRADRSIEVFAACLRVLDGPYGRPAGALVLLERAVPPAEPFTPVENA